MAAGFANDRHRVDLTDAWLLHSYPYKETSLILEVFSRHHGRVAMVARGARRPGSAMRGSLLAFQPLQLSWFGGGELKTVHAVEWQGGVPQLAGLSLICAFYLNELLLKLLPREDEHARVYDAYDLAVRELAASPDSIEPVLRRFEFQLLAELGYGLALDKDSHGAAIDVKKEYRYLGGHGLVPTAECGEIGIPLSGGVLLAMADNDYRAVETLGQAKLLMRSLFGELLGDNPLHTRKLLLDLQRI
jgi:DNA repair protein RecO (recombination protein O)